ncbi:MAG: esterase family protein [Muribaculaceae bacterium]|nr:esterase family protein [Muribaculaceae bacterium]
MKLKILALLFAVLFAGVSSAKTNQVDTINVPAKAIKSPMRCAIILPEKYFNNNDTAHYPVVYLLHGYGGDYSSWLKLTEPRLDSLASHYNMILVCPDGRDSWYWDSPVIEDLQMETFITKELVPYIDANFRTIPVAEKRAVTGFSMGGHGSMWLAMRHSDIFGSAGSMSGGLNINKPKWAKSWKMATRIGTQEEQPQRWIDYTAITLIPSLQPGQLNLVIDCGVDDFFIGVNREFHEALLKHKIPHDYTERPGRHTHPYWRNSLRHHLLYFHEIFSK